MIQSKEKMAHDFYRKAQALHEEFQKRELQYLNAERKWSSTIWKKDLNLPLQEYLQKINKREKETEETYRNMMKQMEELDKHTDLLSLKLEKLGVLRSSLSHIGTPFWSSGLTSSNLQNYAYGATNSFNMNLNSDFSLQQQNSKSVSTQTENIIYCETCRSPLFMTHKPHQPLASENLHMPVTNVQPLTDDKGKTIFNEQPCEIADLCASVANLQLQSGFTHKQVISPGANIDSTVLNASQNVSQFVANSVINEIPTSANTDISFRADSKSIEQTCTMSYEPNRHSAALSQQQEFVSEHNLSHNLIYSNRQKPSKLDSNSNDMSRNKDEVNDTQPHFILNDKIEKSKTRDIEDQSIDASVSKSDVESMNHEFDFLESETVNAREKATMQNKSKILQSSLNEADTNLRKTNKSVSRQNEQLDFDLKPKEANNKIISKSSEVDEAHDNISDTSGPPSIHSPNISASDSDSFYGKETPLTATAAYQALLGNTIIPEQKRSQKYSDSESDEVENALASAVSRGSHVPSKQTSAKKDEKPAPQQVESKPAIKASKPPAANKPKSKLSKSTRKVLGIDTSSGSEVELAVKPPVKKIEEDSDEFDFYD